MPRLTTGSPALLLVFATLYSLTFAATSLPAADELRVLPEEIHGAPPRKMLHNYLQQQLQAALARRQAVYEKLSEPDQLSAYQAQLKQTFLDEIGGLPERTPLHAQVTGKLDGGDYRIEKVIFQSRPHHYVTAVVYLPTKTAGPFPAVLIPCGHSSNGKASTGNQRPAILLAKHGIAAMCYDPIGQGERYQRLDDQGRPRHKATSEHTLVGVGAILVGRGTASYRIWDGMRAIDYLCSRPDIDPQRIGCTGCSGGGTLTSYLMSLDDRVACAAPSCFITSLERLLETLGPQDAEQNIHAAAANGLNHADYLILRAPRPTMILASTRDFFDITGTWQSFREAKRFYTRLGYPERVNLLEADNSHGFPQVHREGMARWMSRWLLQKDQLIEEGEFDTWSDEQLQCTPDGQVMLLPEAVSAFDLNAAEATRLAATRKKTWAAGTQKSLDQVRQATGIRKSGELPLVQVQNGAIVMRDNYRINQILIRSEPGIVLPALVFTPQKPTGGVTLYVHGIGKEIAAAAGGPIEKLVEAGETVVALDVRGAGELGPPVSSKYWEGSFGGHFGNSFRAYLLGRSLLAMRAEDILGTARWISGSSVFNKPGTVRIVGTGELGPAVLHAAALEPELFSAVELRESLRDWASVTQTPETVNQLVNVVHGALRVYDLPDLAQTLGDKLKIVDPRNARGEPIPAGE